MRGVPDVACRPLRARVDPLADRLHIGRRERRFAGRHLQLAGLLNGAVQQALGALAGDHGRTSLAALQDGFKCPNVEIRHPRLSVTGFAIRSEDRSRPHFERRRLGRRSHRKARENQESRRSIPNQHPETILFHPRPTAPGASILGSTDAKPRGVAVRGSVLRDAGGALRRGGLRRYLGRSDCGHRGRKGGRACRASRAGPPRRRDADRRPGTHRYGPAGERDRRLFARVLRTRRQALWRTRLVAIRAQRRRAHTQRMAERSRRPRAVRSPPCLNPEAGRPHRQPADHLGRRFRSAGIHRQQL